MSFLGSGKELSTTDRLVGVLSWFAPRDEDSYVLSNLMPPESVDADEVTMDIAKADSGGMTPAVADGAASPIMPRGTGVGRRSFVAQDWREKTVLDANTVRSLRKLGTREEEVTLEEIVAADQARLRRRLETRMEWARAKVLVDGQLQYTPHGQTITETIDYNHPAYLEPTLTGADLWSNAASTPITDLGNWIDLLEDQPHNYGFTMLIPKAKEAELRTNTQIVTHYDEIFHRHMDAPDLGRGRDLSVQSGFLQHVFKKYIGDINVQIYNAGISYETDLVASASSGQPDIDVDSVEGLEVGQTVHIVYRPTNLMDKAAIQSISGNTITLDDNLAETFPAGSRIRVHVPFLPDDCVILLPNWMPNMLLDRKGMDGQGFNNAQNPLMSENLGAFVSTRNRYLLDDDRPGFYSKLVTDDDGDPPKMSLVSGLFGLPRVDYVERWVRATA